MDAGAGQSKGKGRPTRRDRFGVFAWRKPRNPPASPEEAGEQPSGLPRSSRSAASGVVKQSTLLQRWVPRSQHQAAKRPGSAPSHFLKSHTQPALHHRPAPPGLKEGEAKQQQGQQQEQRQGQPQPRNTAPASPLRSRSPASPGRSRSPRVRSSAPSPRSGEDKAVERPLSAGGARERPTIGRTRSGATLLVGTRRASPGAQPRARSASPTPGRARHSPGNARPQPRRSPSPGSRLAGGQGASAPQARQRPGSSVSPGRRPGGVVGRPRSASPAVAKASPRPSPRGRGASGASNNDGQQAGGPAVVGAAQAGEGREAREGRGESLVQVLRRARSSSPKPDQASFRLLDELRLARRKYSESLAADSPSVEHAIEDAPDANKQVPAKDAKQHDANSDSPKPDAGGSNPAPPVAAAAPSPQPSAYIDEAEWRTLPQEEIYMRHITDPLLQRVFGEQSVFVTSSITEVPFILVPTQPDWAVDMELQGGPPSAESDPGCPSPDESEANANSVPAIEVPFVLITPEDMEGMTPGNTPRSNEGKGERAGDGRAEVNYKTVLPPESPKPPFSAARERGGGPPEKEQDFMQLFQKFTGADVGKAGPGQSDGAEPVVDEAGRCKAMGCDRRAIRPYDYCGGVRCSQGKRRVANRESRVSLSGDATELANSMFRQTGRAVYLQLADKLKGNEVKDLKHYEASLEFKLHPLNAQLESVKRLIAKMFAQRCRAEGCSNEAVVPYQFCGGRLRCLAFGEMGEGKLPSPHHRRASSTHLVRLLASKTNQQEPRRQRAFSLAEVLRARRHAVVSAGGPGRLEDADAAPRAMNTRHSIMATAQSIVGQPGLLQERNTRELSMFRKASMMVEKPQSPESQLLLSSIAVQANLSSVGNVLDTHRSNHPVQ